MTELLTAAQMRAIEKSAIDSGEVTGLELMERAGQGVVEAIFEEWPEFAKTSYRAVVLCGPGNNGGDGFVVARLLRDWGWNVDVFFFGTVENLSIDARRNFEDWLKLGPVKSLSDETFDGYIDLHADLALVIDALFGIGLSRPFSSLGGVQDEVNYAQSIVKDGRHIAPQVVCIDVPSGLNADAGTYPSTLQSNPMDLHVVANLTVTFHRPKSGHYLRNGPIACGKLVIKDIGLKSFLNGEQTPRSFQGTKTQIAPIFQTLCSLVTAPSCFLVQKRSAHKFNNGHALIASGPETKTGAGRLSAYGALRIGAGLVTIASPACALPENAAHLTAVMLANADTIETYEHLLSDARITALCLGPGLGLEEGTKPGSRHHSRQLVAKALASGKKTILDADALTAFQDDPQILFDRLHKNCVLTPHEGEFKRLFPEIYGQYNAPASTAPVFSKVDATREAAKRAGCTILFKGADTVIADERGVAAINSAHYERAAPWLATAGSGDVLSGFIAGLMARGIDPMSAAQSAAWLHVACALKFGPGLIAQDIADQLPAVFRDLGL